MNKIPISIIHEANEFQAKLSGRLKCSCCFKKLDSEVQDVIGFTNGIYGVGKQFNK